MEVGVVEHPEWFPHLNETSSPELVQCELRDSASVLACTDTPCGIQLHGRGISGFRCPEYSGHVHALDDHHHEETDERGHASNDTGGNSGADLAVHGANQNEAHSHTMPPDANLGCLTEAAERVETRKL